METIVLRTRVQMDISIVANEGSKSADSQAGDVLENCQ